MTADPLTSAVARAAPRFTVDTLTLSALGHTDPLGRSWELTAVKGWDTPAAPRTAREARSNGHGSYRGAAYRGDKTVSLSGTVHIPDPMLVKRTQLELAGLCGNPDVLYPLTGTSGGYALVRDVELDAEPEIETVGFFDLDFSFTFAAPDPRAFDATWSDRTVKAAAPSTGTLVYPLTYVIDYGAAPTPTPAVQQVNSGSASVGPLLRLTGPLPSRGAVMHRESGALITWLADIATGERWWINCDDQPQRGIGAHDAYSDARGPVRPLLRVSPDWPVLDPYTAGTFELLAAGDPTASELMASLRSAWL